MTQVTPLEGWHGRYLPTVPYRGSALLVLITYISGPFQCCAVLRRAVGSLGHRPALPVSATTTQLRVRRTTRPTSQQPRNQVYLSTGSLHKPTTIFLDSRRTTTACLLRISPHHGPPFPHRASPPFDASMPNSPPLFASLCNRAQATYHSPGHFPRTPVADHYHHHQHHHNGEEEAARI